MAAPKVKKQPLQSVESACCTETKLSTQTTATVIISKTALMMERRPNGTKQLEPRAEMVHSSSSSPRPPKSCQRSSWNKPSPKKTEKKSLAAPKGLPSQHLPSAATETPRRLIPAQRNHCTDSWLKSAHPGSGSMHDFGQICSDRISKWRPLWASKCHLVMAASSGCDKTFKTAHGGHRAWKQPTIFGDPPCMETSILRY